MMKAIKERTLYWAPRILAILAILFMMMFSLDCFEGPSSFKEQLICFFMHNIPAFVVIAILVLAWNWEWMGGVLFVAAFFAMSIFFFGFSRNYAALIVTSPFLITGLLFLLHYYLYLRKTNSVRF